MSAEVPPHSGHRSLVTRHLALNPSAVAQILFSRELFIQVQKLFNHIFFGPIGIDEAKVEDKR